MNEMDTLRAAQPDVPAPGEDVLGTALARVLNEAPPRARRLTPSAPRLRTVLAGALVTAAAAGVLVVWEPTGNGAAPASAAEVLRRAADTTRAAAETAPRPDQWIYIESTFRGVPGKGVMWAPGEDADTPRPTTVFRSRSWYPATGSKLKGCRPIPQDPHGCAVQFATLIQQINGREERLGLPPGIEDWDPDSQKFVDSLPTDPAALLGRIHAQVDQKSDWGDFDRDQSTVEEIADLMDGYLPRAVRAALYEVLAGVPGVSMQRDAVDYAGRHGIGFSRTGRGERVQIILARGTYRYLGDRLTDDKGTVLRWSAQLDMAVVDKARQLPK